MIYLNPLNLQNLKKNILTDLCEFIQRRKNIADGEKVLQSKFLTLNILNFSFFLGSCRQKKLQFHIHQSLLIKS
jgi:hypothetical protein